MSVHAVIHAAGGGSSKQEVYPPGLTIGPAHLPAASLTHILPATYSQVQEKEHALLSGDSNVCRARLFTQSECRL